jgi:rhodanese-related sulfurtransferase
MTCDANSSPIEIDCRSVRAKLVAGADLILLDCREPREYELVHLADATLLPMDELPARIDEVEPHRAKEIVVYCHLGIRSLQVATWLREQGFSRAKSMIGGIEQWTQEIDPTLARY